MTKKLFIVSTEMEMVVLAESAEEAQKAADKISSFDWGEPYWQAQPMSWLPGDWDLDCLPYGDDENLQTVGELIKEGAAPEYVILSKLSKKVP